MTINEKYDIIVTKDKKQYYILYTTKGVIVMTRQKNAENVKKIVMAEEKTDNMFFIPVDATPEELGILSYAYDMLKGIVRIDASVYNDVPKKAESSGNERELTEEEKNEISRKLDELFAKEKTSLSELTEEKICIKIDNKRRKEKTGIAKEKDNPEKGRSLL